MMVEIDEKFGYASIKAEGGDDALIPYAIPSKHSGSPTGTVTGPTTTTIIIEEEFFNIHGYIFESDLEIKETILPVQDLDPRMEQETEELTHNIDNDNIEFVCPKKVSVKLTRLSNRMMSKVLCPKNVVIKLKKLSMAEMNRYQCTHCPKRFRNKITMKNHLLNYHRTMECRICSKTFSHSGALKQHLQKHMGEKTMNNLKMWSCSFCKMKFFTSQELNVHQGTHTDVPFYQCKMCPMSFTVKCHHQSHEREHTRKSNMERPFECYLCKRKFALQHFLLNHMRIHTKKYDCRICLQLFNREADLDMHMLTHSGKHRYECRHCKRGFDYRTSFVRHLRIHNDEKPFECELCHKKFREKDYLIAHKRTHSADKTIDRTKFTWKYSFDQKFRQSKTNSRDGKTRTRVGKVFKCKICFKILKNENELNSHFEGHTGKYLFECQQCEKGFDYRQNLYRHMKIHLGLKPYKCDLCPNVYGVVA